MSTNGPTIDRNTYPLKHRPAYYSRTADRELRGLEPALFDYPLAVGSEKEIAARITARMIGLGRSLQCLTLDDSEDSLARGLVLAAGLCLATVEQIKPRPPADESTGLRNHTEALLAELNERYGWSDLTIRAIREMAIADSLLQPLLWTLENSLKDVDRDRQYREDRAWRNRFSELPPGANLEEVA